MICERASKAEAMLATTVNGGHHSGQLFLLNIALNSVHTFRCWTPFQIILVVNVGSGKEYFISAAMSASFRINSREDAPVLDLVLHQQLECL